MLHAIGFGLLVGSFFFFFAFPTLMVGHNDTKKVFFTVIPLSIIVALGVTLISL